MIPLLIWGAGGHAAVVADIVALGGTFAPVGFIDEVDPSRRECLAGAVLGGREALPGVRESGCSHAVVAVGDCAVRLEAAAVLVEHGFTLAVLSHPASVVASSALVERGTVIAAGAVIGVRARIGANVIVNTRASVDHDCQVDEGVHVCPASCLAGGVRVGRGTWVGAGTTVIDGVSIGARTLVGAGSLVLESIPDGVVAYGAPARVIRRRDA